MLVIISPFCCSRLSFLRDWFQSRHAKAQDYTYTRTVHVFYVVSTLGSVRHCEPTTRNKLTKHTNLIIVSCCVTYFRLGHYINNADTINQRKEKETEREGPILQGPL